jgi:hypothetical protein
MRSADSGCIRSLFRPVSSRPAVSTGWRNVSSEATDWVRNWPKMRAVWACCRHQNVTPATSLFPPGSPSAGRRAGRRNALAGVPRDPMARHGGGSRSKGAFLSPYNAQGMYACGARSSLPSVMVTTGRVTIAATPPSPPEGGTSPSRGGRVFGRATFSWCHPPGIAERRGGVAFLATVRYNPPFRGLLMTTAPCGRR